MCPGQEADESVVGVVRFQTAERFGVINARIVESPCRFLHTHLQTTHLSRMRQVEAVQAPISTGVPIEEVVTVEEVIT